MSKSFPPEQPGKTFTLSPSQIFKLKKEASLDEDVFEQLCLESITRKWLKSNSIPSLRNPTTPIKDRLNKSNGRYSILLSDGSRFLVKPVAEIILSLEMLASAKCFGVLFVQFDRTNFSGQIVNCIFIKNISVNRTTYSSAMKGLESCSAFLFYLEVPKNYIIAILMFSIKLLIIGEPDAPERGAEGIIPLYRIKSELQEVQND